MFNRNRDGKQDRSDLVKLMEMGLLDFSDEFRDVIHIMCHGTPHLIKAIEHEIRNIILHPKIQS